MSISGALSNALSGLTATSRAADVAASNIANVMTDGYGVREIVLTPRSVGDDGGVQVTGIIRHEDAVLLADRREAETKLANSSITSDFYSRLQNQFGLPTEEGSLTSRMANLESALVQASNSPESEPLLNTVVSNLKSITELLNNLSNSVQQERARADKSIETEVNLLNTNLEEIAELTDGIRKYMVLGHDVSALLDQRQSLIDQVNETIPVMEIDRGNGEIALMTSGGQFLFDGKASTVEFSAASGVTPFTNVTSGTLSTLSINDVEIDTLNDSPISGGKLDALFKIRDDQGVEVQAQLDGFSRDLIERLQESSVDSTRASTDPGLLTDDGSLFDTDDELGLSARISVNSLVDPEEGGEPWRIRDGIGVSSPIPDGEGNSSTILAIAGILSESYSASSTALTTSENSASGRASELISNIGGNLEISKLNRTYAQSQYTTLKEIELSNGVDTDSEMQKLLLIEQSYAANARVVQVIDEMLDWLMGI